MMQNQKVLFLLCENMLVLYLLITSVPAHVEMMGFIGMGNNPMVGATVAVAVAVEESMK
jgi:hypothetical protein